MKRKIFTLLAAFMALATFHANAQGGTGYEAPHFIDVWVHNNGTSWGGAPNYPLSLDNEVMATPGYDRFGARVDAAAPLLRGIIGSFSVDDDGVFYLKQSTPTGQSAGEFGNLNDYITIEEIGGLNQSKQYRFWTYEITGCPDFVSGKKAFALKAGNVSYDKWEVVRFSDNPAWDQVHAVTPEDGGFLCVPSAREAYNEGRLIVVRVMEADGAGDFKIETNELALVTPQALSDPANLSTNTNPAFGKYRPIWIKTNPIVGRWAQLKDFKNFPDFIQIRTPDGNCSMLEVEGTDGKMYNKFKVAYTGYHAWDAVWHDFGLTPNWTTVYGLTQTNPTMGPSVLYQWDPVLGNDIIQLFSFISPENASTLITVAKGNNVYGKQWQTSIGAFGDKLMLEAPADTLTGLQDDIEKFKTQQFAIWIDADGSLSLYPRGAYTYAYGSITQDMKFKDNNAILWNAPYIGPSFVAMDHGFNESRNWTNEAYRIGKTTEDRVLERESAYVSGPTVYDTRTDYIEKSYQFYFFDITAYNRIPQKRYFYLESKTTGRDGKKLVLDVVRQLDSNGDVQNKLVLTDREANRFVKGSNALSDTVYFETPYDSLNMSACWSIRYVYNTDYDPMIAPANRDTIGYVFENEEGIVLAYDYLQTSWAAYDSTEFAAYLKEQAPLAGTVGSEVWKTLSFKDAPEEYFFLRNLRGFDVNDFIVNNKPIARKYLVASPDSFDIRIDTTNTKLFDTNWITSWYYNSVDTLSPGFSHQKYPTQPRKTYYNSAYSYEGLSFNSKTISGVIERNVGTYRVNQGGDPSQPVQDLFYDVYNPFGLELKLAAIHVNKDENLAPHDSIINGEYEWNNYEVDSLWIYLNKTPGLYFIREALGWTEVMKKHNSSGILWMGLPPTDLNPADSLGIERVDMDLIEKMAIANPTEAEARVFNDHNGYKWYYIYAKGKNNAKTYLQYDSIRPELNVTDEQRNGFRFNTTDKGKATMFRFYQPLVGDKELEYFIIETFVPERRYETSNGNIVNSALTTFIDPGVVKYAILKKDSKEIGVTRDAKLATRWDFFLYSELEKCRFDYIDNNFLVDTKMYGAPMTAERVKSKNDARTGSGRFISEGTKYGTTEDTPANSPKIYFTLVPSDSIYVYDKTTPGDHKGRISGGYAWNAGDDFNFGNETRPVQLYYVRRIESDGVSADTTYMTVTKDNIYSQNLDHVNPSVSGDMIKFEHLNRYSNVGGYTNDSTLLQKFAIYGNLGVTQEDRDRLCIYPIDPESFGQFVFIPAAAYVYDYLNEKTLKLVRNNNIGNSDYTDEFRVGAKADGYTYMKEQLIVVPAWTSNTQGEPASEYIFKYEMYKGDFSCVNFVQGAVGNYIASNAPNAKYAHDYADPSSQWTLTKALDEDPYYKYTFDAVANQMRSQKKVTRSQLGDEYYLYLINEGKTEYQKQNGDWGYERIFNAVKRIERDPVTNNYKFGPFNSDVQYLKITEITNDYPGDLRNKERFDASTRKYKGDSTVDYYFRFSDGETFEANWKIVEGLNGDRFIWARDYQNPISGKMEAYAQDITPDRPAEYLSIIKSWVDTIAECDGKVLHAIPYYNIVYTLSTGEKHYLKVTQGTEEMKFETPSVGVLNDLAANPSSQPDYNFCFPYRLSDESTIMYYSNDINLDVYWSQLILIQSQVHETKALKPTIARYDGNSSNLEGTIKESLYDLDYILPTNDDMKDFNATSWFFGPKLSSDDVWIRLHKVPANTEAWMRASESAVGLDYFVASTTEPANGVYYAQLTSRTAVDVEKTKLTFEFVDSARLGSYDPKRIWYYNIKNADNKYLTSAGGSTDPDLVWTPEKEGYAYFTDKLSSDPTFKQAFGLKWINPSTKDSEDPDYSFWVVAGVDSTKDNTLTSPYYYLAQNNSRLVFRNGGGTKKQETEQSAMVFEIGIATSDDYTGIDGADNDAVNIYGVEGAVIVQNAEGTIELFTIDGRLVKSVVATGAVQTIQAPQGVLIVKNNNNVVAKVVVK